MVSENEAELIVASQADTEAFFKGRSLGRGTLCISHNVLTWQEDSKRLGFTLRYPNISLHAIRREPVPSLYMMIDFKLELPEGLAAPDDYQPAEDNVDDESEDEENCFTELMFAPSDQQVLERLFTAMSECQALHPDPNESFSDEDFELYEDAPDIQENDHHNGHNETENMGGPVEEEMEGLNINSTDSRATDNGDMDCNPD